MPSNVRQLLDNGVPVYPITDKSLVIGLQDVPFESYVVAWDGASTPVPANIPAGVVVTYNTTDYTGTLAAGSATAPYLYLVASASQQGEYDRYIVTHTGSTYAWTQLGSTAPVSPVIADNLTTNDASKALSAKQGKILGEEVGELEAKETDLEGVLDVEGTGDRVLAHGATNSSFINYQNGDTTSSSANKSTNGIDVSEYRGKTIQYVQNVYTVATGQVGMAFYDSSDTFVSGVPCHFGGTTEGVEETTTVVPNNATFAKFTIFKDYADAFYVKAFGDYHSVRLDDLEAKIDGVTTRNYTEGYKVLQSGALEEDSTSVVCDKVPVSFGDTLSLNKAYSYLCAYDANDVKLNHWSARASVSLTATADQNVAYVLCSFLKANLATAYIKKGATTLWRPESSHTPGLIENVDALEDGVEELETSVDNNTEDIATLNVKIDGQEQNYIPGKVMKSTGATEDEVSAFLSENIPVSQGDTIRFHQVYGFLCVFDSEGNRLDYWSDSYNDTDQSLSGATFANAAYMAASFKKTNKATATISKNGVVVFKAKEEVIGINEKLANKEALSIRIPSGGFITQSGTFKETQAGNTYTIFPSQRSWDVSAVSDGQAIFWIETGHRSLYDVRKGSDLAESYEITLQEGEYLRIYVRGTRGQTLSFVSETSDKTQIQTNKEKIADLYHKFAGEDILDLHPAPVMEPILANLQYYRNPYDWSFYGDKPLTLLFFSDLHACSIPLQRIMQFANAYGSYIDDVVCGGDMVNSFNNGFDFWSAAGANKVLPVIGNHEVIGGSPSIDGHAITSYTKHSAKALYEMVVEPFLAQTGITVDEDKCYWYKDYDSCKIRVIALDIYHYNDTITVEGGATYTTYPDGGTSDQGEQATWFAETLAEAKTKNYAVICLRHGPFLFDLMENPFTSMEFQNTTASGLINPANNSVVNMVQDFIDGGGVFLAWLTGHIHQDAVGTVKDFPDQFQMTIDTSRYHYNGIDGVFLPYGSNIKIEGRTKAADCFDIFSVDTYKKNITLFRVGSEYDRNGRHIGSLVYNYEEKRLIYV